MNNSNNLLGDWKKKAWYNPRRDEDGNTKYFSEETQCVEGARCFIKKHYMSYLSDPVNDPVQLATDIT